MLVAQSMVSPRYRVLERIGGGGMGDVYRAHDRLAGSHVALKRIALHALASNQGISGTSKRAPPSLTLGFAETVAAAISPILSTDRSTVLARSGQAPEALRLALAQEFRTLASLRHPHVVSVLDYGFDREQLPFFTMELLDDAHGLLAASVRLSLTERVDLLLQILAALTYLHRRGVLHRDIKPANVLVVKQSGALQVRLLDFGLSVIKQSRTIPDGDVAGTLGYMAPEVLLGESASESADLYSFGVVACELLTGHALFSQHDTRALLPALLDHEARWNEEVMPPAINQVLRRLLERTPALRYESAVATAHALAEAAGVPLPEESRAVRESFLQAAEFVGRDVELRTLRTALGGGGSVWLVGGESGVGKSRLLDELRTWALVNGISVLRGQTQSDGNLGLGLFADALRALSLEVPLDPLEASVVKSVVSDLPQLLGCEIADAPVLDAQAARLRLLHVLAAFLLRVERPTLLLLEDLHWAGAECTELLRLLTVQLQQSFLYVVGSYRDEERPELPSLLPAAQVLPLRRLDRSAVQKLSAFMLGSAEADEGVLDLLWRETEGNTYFLVEVARALSEEAGSLADIRRRHLPHQVFAGGVDAVLERRLRRVPTSLQQLLYSAAVAGRQLDLKLLSTMHGDLEDWLRACADLAVLELSEQQWRFSHDKLRERLLAELPMGEKRRHHQHIAEALERVYPDSVSYASRLGYHYEQAGIHGRAIHFLTQAGEWAVRRGELAEASAVLMQAQSLQQRVPGSQHEQFRVSRLLFIARFGLGRMEECASLFRETLALGGHPMPVDARSLALGLVRQASQQVLHRIHPRMIRPPRDSDDAALLLELGSLHRLGFQVYAWRAELLASAYSVLDGLNLAERQGDIALRTSSYMFMGYLLSLTPLKSAGRSYLDRGQRLLRDCQGTSAEEEFFRGSALISQALGDQRRALDYIERALPIADRLGDLYASLHGAHIRTLSLLFHAEYEAAWQQAQGLLARATQARHDFYLAVTHGLLGAIALRQGQLNEAQDQLDRARSISKEQGRTLLPVYLDAVSLLCAKRRGEADRTRRALSAALQLVETTALTSHHHLDGYPAVVELCLLEWQETTNPAEKKRLQVQHARAARALRRYALIFPIGRPALHLLTGRYQLALGRREAALLCFAKAEREAQELRMPHESALACAWSGKCMGGVIGSMKIESALKRLHAIGATWDAAEVEEWTTQRRQ